MVHFKVTRYGCVSAELLEAGTSEGARKGWEKRHNIHGVHDIDPSVEVHEHPSGRRVHIKGDAGEAEVWQGAGDKRWRLKAAGITDEVSSKEAGVEQGAQCEHEDFPTPFQTTKCCGKRRRRFAGEGIGNGNQLAG